MITIDKPLDRTITALGVSLRTVDRVYLESQATGVHIYHTVNTYDVTTWREVDEPLYHAAEFSVIVAAMYTFHSF